MVRLQRSMMRRPACRRASTTRSRKCGLSSGAPPVMSSVAMGREAITDRKSTRLNSSHSQISYAVFCLKKKTQSESHSEGQGFVKPNRGIVFGHHFAAISWTGRLVGPVRAAQFGDLPGSLCHCIDVVRG